MKVLVTGAAGFIGSALSLSLLSRGDTIVGIDNHNDYYDPLLKEARVLRHLNHPNYTHLRIDLSNRQAIDEVFKTYQPQCVVNLAAQAGVRHSIEKPLSFIDSNILGFAHILEGCRHYNVEHLVYASSSSVYGANTQTPFSIHDNVDHPISLYAASKKANELMAHAYSHLYGLPSTGLRFFTVYGPWMRPDMALFKFTQSILADEPIQIFNYGKHRRDFTYIDDIVKGIVLVLDSPAVCDSSWQSYSPGPASSLAPWRIYNLGNSQSIELMDCITELEKAIGKTAKKQFTSQQPGDVLDTHADVSDMVKQFNYQPTTSLQQGISQFVTWYREYSLTGVAT